MRICILENDILTNPAASAGTCLAELYSGLLRRGGGEDWRYDAFHTPAGEYPADFAAYDATVLTGSGADSFSDEPWVVELRRRVSGVLAARGKVIGICYGHQILGICLGGRVTRAPGGWVLGRHEYAWHDGSGASYGLLASHRDQVLELPPGAKLLASTPACPVAGFTFGGHVFSVQPHPEMDAALMRVLIERRRAELGEARTAATLDAIMAPHDGDRIARMMVAFVAGGAAS